MFDISTFITRVFPGDGSCTPYWVALRSSPLFLPHLFGKAQHCWMFDFIVQYHVYLDAPGKDKT